MKTKAAPLVRYVSPFGSPAWMPLERAEALLAEHDAHWLLNQRAGNLSPEQIRIGPPRIERP